MRSGWPKRSTFLPTATFTPTATETPTPTITPTPVIVYYGPSNFPANVNPLTGLEVSDPGILNRRPMMLKVSNFPREGRPHGEARRPGEPRLLGDRPVRDAPAGQPNHLASARHALRRGRRRSAP